MTSTILPFSLDKSNEKLTDRGAIATVDEFDKAIGLPEKVDRELPAPGSNRGIDPSAYVRTLIYHFSEGGRHIEETRQIKADEGFRSLLDLEKMSIWRRCPVPTRLAIGFVGWERGPAGRAPERQ